MKGSPGPSTSYCFVRWRVLYSVLGGAVACKCRMFIDLNPVKLTDTCVVGYPVADACCIEYVTYVAPPNPYPIYSNFLYPIWSVHWARTFLVPLSTETFVRISIR